MKILILNWRDVLHPRAGGAEMRLHQIYAPLTQQGHEVVLYSCAFKGCKKQETVDGIAVHRMGNDLTFAPLCTLSLRIWVKQHQPDIVVEELNKLPFYSPVVYKGPLMVQMAHLWRNSIFKEASFPVAFVVWFFEQTIGWFYKKCWFSVYSTCTQKDLKAFGAADERNRLIYCGGDLSSYVPGKVEREPFILWISRLQKYKGPTDAVEVLEKLQPDFPDLKLVIVGSGPFQEKLEGFIAERGMQDKVTLTGFISEEEKIDLLQRAAVHLHSSYKEGWGLSVIEANACGCPVVANDTTGLRDSCRDNETGLLYTHCDIDDAASKVRNILTDEPLRNRLVEKGYEWAGGFSWERNTREILEYLQEIIDAGKGA
ncbi:MAG: glycosyltransferase family 4 protein [Verrucomicrobiota bacterium]|nr:glycosyltransferase family 4 protein [Verrucomicrobiota bacterium]